MKKFLLYKMTSDTGFAPNPFGNYLTLATCTPNHQRANIGKGDWIIGVEGKTLAEERKKAGYHLEIEQCLIYAGKVCEVLGLDSYFHDPRFENKKYSPSNPQGDNVYYIENNSWRWIRGHEHDIKSIPDEEAYIPVSKVDEFFRNKKLKEKYGAIIQDIWGNRVFICKEFLYFGNKCIEFNKKFLRCLNNRGIRYCTQEDFPELFSELESYISSLVKEYGFGKHGNPINNRLEKQNTCNKVKLPCSSKPRLCGGRR